MAGKKKSGGGGRTTNTKTELQINGADREVGITVTTSHAAVRRWLLENGAQNNLFGLNLHRSEQRENAVVVLSCATNCLIYQIGRADGVMPRELREFLADEKNTFVTHGDRNKVFGRLGVENATAVDSLSLLLKNRPPSKRMKGSWKKNAATSVGSSLVTKPSQPWESLNLSKDQVRYAISKAVTAMLLGRQLLRRRA